MTTTLVEAEPPEEVEMDHSELPDARVLEDRLPVWMRTSRTFAIYTAILGVVYFILSYQRLWYTDLWGHLSYGRYIWLAHGLPATEPLMPLASGVPFVDTAWLSQLVGFGLFALWGATAMQFLYAVSLTLCTGLMLWRFHQRSRNLVVAVTGLLLFAWMDSQQLVIVRPQLGGFVCFVTLLTLLTARRWHPAMWYVIPILFVFWVNLHGSFPVGFVLLGCFCLGRAIDVFRRTRRIRCAVADKQVRRYFLVTELSALATLMNPSGLAMHGEVLSVLRSPNLEDLVEWAPMTLHMSQGRAMAVVVLLLIALYRFSPRRVSATEFLSLAVLGLGALWTSRLVLWFAPVAAYHVVLHVSAIWHKSKWGCTNVVPRQRTSKWTLISIGLMWIFFGFTPFGMRVIHGSEPSFDRIVAPQTPLGAVQYLREHPPVGQIFNTYEWGDFLIWAGPPDLKVFAASHAHLLPRLVWQNYMQVIELQTGWERTLDAYGINAMVLDTLNRRPLISRMRRNSEWKIGYEDAQSVVYVRRKPID